MEEKKPNMFRRFWQRIWMNQDQHSNTGSPSGEKTQDSGTRESRIHDQQKAKRAALTHRVEKLWAAQEARKDAVLERVRRSSAFPINPHEPSTSAARRSKFCLRGWKVSPVVGEPFLDAEENQHQKTPESWDEEDDSFWRKVYEGSQMAIRACQEAQRPETPSPEGISAPGPENILMTPHPEDLSGPTTKEMTQSLSPQKILLKPTVEEEEATACLPPVTEPKPERKRTRLPVFSDKICGADMKLVNGTWLQSAKNKLQAVAQTMQKLQFAPTPLPRPSNAAKRTSVVTPLAEIHPHNNAPQTKKKGPGIKMFQVSSKSFNKTMGKKKTKASRLKTAKQNKEDLKPLDKPLESLSLVFELLSSDDWTQKQKGLKIVQALAQHHPDVLKTKLQEVCLILSEEVKNLRSSVACEAIDTLTELYSHLKKTMDPQVEGTGRALLLKLAQTTNSFIHQQVNLALDAMVENCTHGRIVSSLLNTGLNHRCVAVRGSMAQHLHQVAENIGVDYILTAGRTFTERFLSAAAKMALDAAPEVRHHGQTVLQELALHPKFLQLWINIVPEKERWPLNKIVKSAKI